MVLGDIIRSQREQRGMTQCELAEVLGIGQATLSSWETGSRTPHARRLPALEEALGLPPRALADAYLSGAV